MDPVTDLAMDLATMDPVTDLATTDLATTDTATSGANLTRLVPGEPSPASPRAEVQVWAPRAHHVGNSSCQI
jgi:hypothetical protein